MAANVGAGEMDGQALFGTHVPSIMDEAGGAPCVSTTTTLTGNSVGAAQATSINGYAGQLSMSGTATSTCETTSHGTGSLTMSITSPKASAGYYFVSCPTLTGTYQRVASAVVAIVSGNCTINNGPPDFVTVAFHGQFVPNGGEGVNTPITGAQFAGAYAFLPL
jgi:hypothetical protein